jgi:hypothetical protein
MRVYLGNRRVGEAKLSPRPGQREIVMPVISGPTFVSPGEVPTYEERRDIRLKLDWAHFRIEARDIAMHGQEYVKQVFKHHGVEEKDCESNRRFEIDATDYRYQVMRVTKDQLEEIFDFDWFEPSESGPRDREYLERRREQLMNSPYPGL